MSDQNPEQGRSLGATIGLILGLGVAIVWVIYGLTGAPHWLLVVGVVYSILVGGYWAIGRQLIDGGRRRN